MSGRNQSFSIATQHSRMGRVQIQAGCSRWFLKLEEVFILSQALQVEARCLGTWDSVGSPEKEGEEFAVG